MSFENSTNNGNNQEEHKHGKPEGYQISRTDMNMLIMNYLVTGDVVLCFIILFISRNDIMCLK